MWEIYKWDGRYIQGDFISKHSSAAAALKAAKKVIDYKKNIREIRKTEIVIWLDDEDGTPMGIIVKPKPKPKPKPKKGAKRIRQSKKEKKCK